MSQAILVEEDRLFRDTVRSWIDAEIGKGWGYSTATLNNERLVNAAFCLGMLDGVLEDALEHLQTRRAFGHVIGEFQALQHYVADIAMWQKQGELMLLDGARLPESPRARGERQRRAASRPHVSRPVDGAGRPCWLDRPAVQRSKNRARHLCYRVPTSAVSNAARQSDSLSQVTENL